MQLLASLVLFFSAQRERCNLPSLYDSVQSPFRLIIGKPKPKESEITLKNQCEGKVEIIKPLKRGKTRATKSWLVLVSPLIG